MAESTIRNPLSYRVCIDLILKRILRESNILLNVLKRKALAPEKD